MTLDFLLKIVWIKKLQSLVPHSQNMDLDSSNVESSQSIIPHSLQYGLRSTNLNPREGDLVVVHLRRIGRGRSVTKVGLS